MKTGFAAGDTIFIGCAHYQNDYLYRITFNGSTVWQATTIDEYSRIRAASIGATSSSWSYNSSTNLLSQIKGTGVLQHDYAFDGATGNLNSRTKGTLSESFNYDTQNLDRLTLVNGPEIGVVTYQPDNKGNIQSKSDAGSYTYHPDSKYAVTEISYAENISTIPQHITYTAFNKVETITEGTKTAEFIYNADHQRIRMTLKDNGAVTKTRWYFGSSFEREQAGSTVTQYIWIGGDAYTAKAVAKKTGTASWMVYNIFRDHLGTITHLKTGSTITEYSFDAWGRRRDKDTWSYTLSSEPALFADRGFTAHEYLEDFKLYNMNGRLYDPIVGRLLSPDSYITDQSFTQSYNRYSYCLNNPLRFTDYSGYTWWSDFWGWVGNGFNNLGNWMTRNNIQVQVGVNISGDGTVPFAGISGPNNFNMNTKNFVKQPTGAIQSIHQQVASFSGMDMELPFFVDAAPRSFWNGVSSWAGVVDWEGTTNASINVLGGVGEMIIGGAGEYFSAGTATPVCMPLIIDGGYRTATNFSRLVGYLTLNDKFANAMPGNIGATIGKGIDILSGEPIYNYGYGQGIGGVANDFVSFIITGGTAGSMNNMMNNPTLGNGIWYFSTYGGYTNSLFYDLYPLKIKK